MAIFGTDPARSNGVKFRIPFLAEETQDTQKPRMSINAPTQPAGTQAKILVVDDDNLYAKVISFKLRGAGYQVATALDGAEAISVARREKPDLILLDLTFPPDVSGGLTDGFRIME